MDLLKPNYNAVDLSQIEHPDSDYDRNMDPRLMEVIFYTSFNIDFSDFPFGFSQFLYSFKILPDS
jgi:hypothetical protein